MSRMTIAGPDGPVEVEELGFTEQIETWNQYVLDDGTKLRIKLVLTNAYRALDGETYLTHSQNIVRTHPIRSVGGD